MLIDALRGALLLLAQAAPYLLLGLLFAGLLHVLLPEKLVLRWMGRPGLSGVVRAAAIGVPLPVCSCGVVPIAVELRRKGASTPASQSFVITTPESSVDSILLTWGMMGPVMAIARPLAAFATAVLGGVLTILGARSLEELRAPARQCASCTSSELDGPSSTPGDEASGHDHDHHDHHHHDHDHHDHDHDLVYDGGDGARSAVTRLVASLWRRGDRKDQSESHERPAWEELRDDVVRPSLRYGFGELLDDLAFWLVVGLVVAGALTSVLPQDLAEIGLGSGFAPLLLALVVGIPIYMCASASTPIAAALLAQGLSPGAALVFLLAGPATNVATVILLAGTFGRRFVRTYLLSVVLGSLGAGWLLDVLVARLGWRISAAQADTESIGAFSVLCAVALVLLLVRSLRRGAWSRGWRELESSTLRMLDALLPGGVSVQRAALAAALLVLAIGWALGGLRVVPVDSRGFAFTFGRLSRADVEPGLRFHPPPPIGRWELRRVHYPRKADVGFRTEVELLADRRRLPRPGENEWHSPLAAMNSRPEQSVFLTADEYFVEMNFTVHYGLEDSESFFYGMAHDHDLVVLYAESTARLLVASAPLEGLLTEQRSVMQERIASALQGALDRIGSGIDVERVHIVDIHPPGDAVTAFRDVSTALEDRATRIHEAHQVEVGALPLARGESAGIVAKAEAAAGGAEVNAVAQRDSFSSLAQSARVAPSILRRELRTASAEESLTGRRKVVLPSGTAPGRVLVWDGKPAAPLVAPDLRPSQRKDP